MTTEAIDRASKSAGSAHMLLVACDFDGVLAPIAPTPSAAIADPGSMAALRALSRMPRTQVAVISGRPRADLERLLPDAPWILKVGSHGAEGDLVGTAAPTDEERRIIESLAACASAWAATRPGVVIEPKPLGIAVHVRLAAPEDARDLAVLAARCRAFPGVVERVGHAVREFTVSPRTKGDALRILRRRLGVTATIAIGDDATDEDMFAVLDARAADLGIVVGRQQSAATSRLDGQHEVLPLLESIRRARAVETTIVEAPIDQHRLLSDQRSLALVDPRGSIVWGAVPRADAPPVFSALLGGEACGSFDLAPADGRRPTTFRYERDSMVAETMWDDGAARLVDYFDASAGRPYQRAGRSDLVRVVSGSGVPMRARFAPRPDFGRTPVRLGVIDAGVVVQGLPDPIVLFAPGLRWRIVTEGRHESAIAEFDADDHPRTIELRCGAATLRDAPIAESLRREQTGRFWSAWLASLSLPTLHRDAVARSCLALKALAHGPTGAMLAAATTSLPEELGGVRNWDYRFCWPRDAAFAATALARVGNTGHAMRLADWILGVVERSGAPDRLRPIYTVTGSHLGTEGDVTGVAGYARSVPVRVGNAAAMQVQLDVFGPIVDMVATMVERGAPVSPDHLRLVSAMVDAVALRWREPDHGIWELRIAPRHHVYSRTMAWHTVARAIDVERQCSGHAPEAWLELARTIRDDVLANGFDHSVGGGGGAFTTAYGSSDLDAAALHVGISGLVPPDDPRFRATVRAVERDLRVGPTVLRYRFDDGLPGLEGGFVLCALWLVESYALIGEGDRAHELLESLLSVAGPLGLMAEEYCPRVERSLGNYPQAYSHAGLVNAVVRLDSR